MGTTWGTAAGVEGVGSARTGLVSVVGAGWEVWCICADAFVEMQTLTKIKVKQPEMIPFTLIQLVLTRGGVVERGSPIADDRAFATGIYRRSFKSGCSIFNLNSKELDEPGQPAKTLQSAIMGATIDVPAW
ncbi:MAG: hypothetical protein AAFP90_09895 [Planctomycetota bacterium]